MTAIAASMQPQCCIDTGNLLIWLFGSPCHLLLPEHLTGRISGHIDKSCRTEAELN